MWLTVHMFLLCSLLLQDFNSETASEELGWEARELLLWAAAGTRLCEWGPDPPGRSWICPFSSPWRLDPATQDPPWGQDDRGYSAVTDASCRAREAKDSYLPWHPLVSSSCGLSSSWFSAQDQPPEGQDWRPEGSHSGQLLERGRPLCAQGGGPTWEILFPFHFAHLEVFACGICRIRATVTRFALVCEGGCVHACVRALLFQLGSTLGDPMSCSLMGSSDHEILQARILEWVALPSSRGSSWPRDRTHISCVSCIAGEFCIH